MYGHEIRCLCNKVSLSVHIIKQEKHTFAFKIINEFIQVFLKREISKTRFRKQ